MTQMGTRSSDKPIKNLWCINDLYRPRPAPRVRMTPPSAFGCEVRLRVPSYAAARRQRHRLFGELARDTHTYISLGRLRSRRFTYASQTASNQCVRRPSALFFPYFILPHTSLYCWFAGRWGRIGEKRTRQPACKQEFATGDRLIGQTSDAGTNYNRQRGKMREAITIRRTFRSDTALTPHTHRPL